MKEDTPQCDHSLRELFNGLRRLVRNGWTDMVGLSRWFSVTPRCSPKLICRTFSDCTTAPRNGIISGCYPLDDHYKARAEFQELKAVKKATGA